MSNQVAVALEAENDFDSSQESLIAIRHREVPFCPLCQVVGEELYSGLQDWLFGVPGDWGMRQCSACSIAWLDPRPIAEDVPKLYARYYTHQPRTVTWLATLRQQAFNLVLSRMGYSVSISGSLLPRILSYVPSIARAAALDVMGLSRSQVGKLLDVGCGNGEFISRMSALGWNVSGVDPDPRAVAKGQQEGLRIFEGSIADIPKNELYDVITLNHVIEHVADPTELLRQCRRRLRPGSGMLILTTPNVRSLGHRWFKGYWRGLEVPRHFMLFAKHSLAECLKSAGLEIGSVATETRLGRMIYLSSTGALRGAEHLGGDPQFTLVTKLSSYLFQLIEELALMLDQDLGEELFGVSVRPAEDNVHAS